MGIGDLLRREREQKGLSLGDVENATKIRARYIQALETEQFQIIPGEVYRLGFLKNYARLLDLDSDSIIARYKSAHESTDQDAALDEEPAETKQTVANDRRSVRDSDQPGTRQADAVARWPVAWRPDIDWAGLITRAWAGLITRAGSIFQNRRVLLGTASVVVVLLLAYVLFSLGVSHRNTAPPLQQTQKQTQNLPALPPTVNTQPQTLEIRLVGTGHCWAEVRVDGQEAYMGTIKPGETETFTAQSTIWVDLGYPQSVDVYYNGAKLPPLGTTHLVTQTFTKNMGA